MESTVDSPLASAPAATPARRALWRAYLAAIRPRQWLKNGLLFSGLALNAYVKYPELWAAATAGFVVFCLLSGSVYLVNDLLDVEQDRHHPKKKKRPIAAGEISIAQAKLYALVLVTVAWSAAWWLGPAFFACAVAYWLLVLSYSLVFKHVALLDVLSLAAGFVLRAVAGIYVLREACAALGLPLPMTPWFFLCTGFLALFIALCKRRSELAQLGDGSANTRAVLKQYPLQLLDQLIAVSATCAIVTYSLYCAMDPFKTPLLWTLPCVIFGIGRYLLHVYRDNEGGAPETVVLGDRALIANVAVWLVTVVVIIGWKP